MMGSELVCDLMTASVRIGSRWRTTAGMRSISAVVHYILRSRANCCLQRFSKDTVILAELVHLQGTPDVDGAGTGYGLRSSCGVRYVVCG